jgi:hypothetical protein
MEKIKYYLNKILAWLRISAKIGENIKQTLDDAKEDNK